MSLKLSRNKVNYLSSLVARYIENNEEIDYSDDIGNIRLKIFHLIMNELRIFEQIELEAKERVKIQKRTVPEGSREWEILFRKYVSEELAKLGKLWRWVWRLPFVLVKKILQALYKGVKQIIFPGKPQRQPSRRSAAVRLNALLGGPSFHGPGQSR